MKKVYCKNCRAVQGRSDTGYDKCVPLEFINRFIEDINKDPLYRKDENREGNCKHYQRKWYKFWVK